MDTLFQAAELLANGTIKPEPRTGSAFSTYVRTNGGTARSSAPALVSGDEAGASAPQDSHVQPMDATPSMGTTATGLLRPTPTAALPSYSAVVNSLACKSEAAREAAHSLRLEQSGLVATPHPLAAVQPAASLHQLLQAMYSQQLLQPVQQALLLNGSGISMPSPRAGAEQVIAYQQPMQLQQLQQAQWAATMQQQAQGQVQVQAQAQAHSTPSPTATHQESTPELAQEQRPSHSPPAPAQPQQYAGEPAAVTTTAHGGGDLVAAADAFRMHAPLTGQQLQELTGQQGFRDEMKAMMDGMDAEGSGLDGEREGDGAGGSSDTEDDGAGAANGLANDRRGSKALSGTGNGGSEEGSGQDEMDAQQAADELMEVVVASETEKGCSAYLPVPYMSRGLPSRHNGASSSGGSGQLAGQKRKAPGAAESDLMGAGMELAGGGQAGMPAGLGAGVGVGLNGRSKKPRLIWTAELHARFLNAVNTLGVKSAVPKTILQLMNVEGMTRENVASHLQKYRLYLKRCSNLPPGSVPPDAFAQMMGGASHMFGAQPLHQANASVLAPMQLSAPATVAAKPAPAVPIAAANSNSPLHQTQSNGPAAMVLQQVQPAAKPAAAPQPEAGGIASVPVAMAPMPTAAPSSLEMLGAALTSQLQAQQLQQLQAAMAAAATGSAGNSQGILVAGGAGPLAMLSAAGRGLDPLGALTNGRTLQVHMPLSLPLAGFANGLLAAPAPPNAASASAQALSLLPATMNGNMMSLLQAAGSQQAATHLHQQLHAMAAQQLMVQASGLSTCSNNNQGPQVVSQAVS